MQISTIIRSLLPKELLKLLLKTFVTNRNALQIILLHTGLSEAMHIKILKTLEDPEQRP